MINNRQNGRRRGRGGQGQGQGQRGGNPGAPNGNRIDNRSRGNANQLYEKYKALAADAQRQGDRVNTEYWLQFADHYFRVLSENRPRFEEQQRRAREDMDDESDDAGEEFGVEGEPVRADGWQPRRERDDRQRDDRPREARAEGERQERGDRPDRQRDDRRPRNGWRDREAAGASEANGHAVEVPVTTQPDPVTEDASAPHMADMDAPQPRRRGRPRRERAEEAPAAPEGFEADRLPPSLSVSASAEPDAAAEAERPRRRRRTASTSEASPAE